MWGFFWLIWMVPLLLFVIGARRRRWRRWAMMGPGGYGYMPYGPGWVRERGAWGGALPAGDALTLRREVEEQRAYVDALESRIAELEERLDFTERLLSGRRDAQGGP